MNQSAAALLNTVYHLALDAIFPPRCAGCRTWSDDIFCPACRASLKPILPPLCACCGTPCDPLTHPAALCAECRPNRYHGAPPFVALRSLYAFEGPIRHAVHRFKYQDKRALADPLAALLRQFLQEQSSHAALIPVDRLALITPVPLHPWRRYRRGYNQSELLARELGKRLGVAVSPLLRRTRHTAPQIELAARQRVENVSDAFAVDAVAWREVKVRDGAILLIDDVVTTGSTLRECARVLKAAGAGEIYALTLARQI